MQAMGRGRAIGYAGIFVGLILLDVLFRRVTWTGSSGLHTAMEVAATLLALFVGALALVYYYTQKKTIMLYIGAGFLGTAILDGYHAVVTASFFKTHFPTVPASLIPWSWVASRLLLSIFLVLTWAAWKRESLRGGHIRPNEKAIYSFVGVLTVAVFLIFALLPLPSANHPDQLFSRPQEWVPALFFLIAFVGHYRKGQWRTDHFEHWLLMSILVGFMTQAGFMTFSEKSYDTMFDVAHLLKKVSYVLVLSGLFVSMFFEFKRAEEREELARQKEQLVRLVAKAGEASVEMNALAADLHALSERSQSGNDRLIGTFRHVVEGARAQAGSSRESAVAVEEIARGIQHIAEISSGVSEASNRMSARSQEGYSTMQQAVNQITRVQENVAATADTIRTLQEQSGQIQKITMLIGEIAGQTNLLSLNASIEAARAGEHGKGFAVVASEVKKLAVQAEQATKQIAEQIESILAETRRSGEAMGAMHVEVEQGVKLVGDSGAMFQQILEAADAVDNQIQNVSAAAEQISASSQEVLASVEEMSRLAADAEEQSGHASGLVEANTAELKQFAEAIERLNTMVAELQDAVSAK